MYYDHLEMDDVQLDEVKTIVREKYPNNSFPNVYQDVLWRGVSRKGEDHIPIKKRQAIVMEREGAETVAAICSEDYMLIPHEWAVWRFEQALAQMPQYGPSKVSVNLFSDGAKMRLSALFPEVDIKIGNDPINPSAGIRNSYDLSLEWEAFFGARVIRCTNGLLMFKKLSNGGGKHRMSLDLNGNISQIQSGMEKLDEQYQIWGNWFHKQLGETETMQMLEESPLSDKQVKNVLELPEIGTNHSLEGEFKHQGKEINGWFLSSVITQYMTHEMEDTASKLGLEERMTTYLHKALN